MSNYSHRGYEQRTSGYGRRRHKASGFRKKNTGSGAAKGAAAVVSVAAIAVLAYLFADNIIPFLGSIRGTDTGSDTETLAETQDSPDIALTVTSVPTADEPTEIPPADGYFDNADDNIFISGGAGYVKFKGIDSTARNYTAILNSISRNIPSGIDMYDIVLPTNAEIGIDGYIPGSNSQKDNLDVISLLLSDKVKYVDAYSALKAHNSEYLYYRTDPALTALGGYYAYTGFADKSGNDAYTLSELSKKKYGISPFEGEYIERTTDNKAQPHGNQELFNNPDSIEYYKLPVHYNCYEINRRSGSRTEFDLFSDKNAASDPLSVFPGKDKDFLAVYNLQSDNTDKLLIVKDHAAEPVIGFIIPHYSEIYIADVSLYSGDLHSVISEYGITDIIFINGIDDANNSLYCQRLRDLFDNGISD